VTGVQGKPRPASESRGRVSSLAPGSGPRRSIIFSGEMEGNEERGSPINWDSGNRGGSPPGPGRHVTRLKVIARARPRAASPFPGLSPRGRTSQRFFRNNSGLRVTVAPLPLGCITAGTRGPAMEDGLDAGGHGVPRLR
jgi:hypothetical protein